MSKQQDILRERKIYNVYEIAKLGDKLFVDYSINDGRSCLPSWWSVHYVDKHFKDTAWYEYGAKTFTGKKKDKEVLQKAINFASKFTKCKEWVKSPFDGYVTRYTADTVGFKYDINKIIKGE